MDLRDDGAKRRRERHLSLADGSLDHLKTGPASAERLGYILLRIRDTYIRRRAGPLSSKQATNKAMANPRTSTAASGDASHTPDRIRAGSSYRQSRNLSRFSVAGRISRPWERGAGRRYGQPGATEADVSASRRTDTGATGNVKHSVLPTPRVLSAQIRPPWASTMHLEM